MIVSSTDFMTQIHEKLRQTGKSAIFSSETAAKPAEKQQEKKTRKNRKLKTNKPKPYKSTKILRTNTNRNIKAKSERAALGNPKQT